MKLQQQIKKWWLRQLVKIQSKAREKSKAAAIKEASKLTAQTGQKVLIYFIDGEYKVVTKQRLKKTWHNSADLKNLYTVQELENKAQIKDVATKKLSAEEIKKLQEETLAKKNKIVKK